MNTLPKEIKAGDEVEVQLAPVGEYPQVVNGQEIKQIVDEPAIASLVANFGDDVLVDADHDSESGRGTEAMAWVKRVFADPDRGLVGVFKFTDKGANAVSQSRYRFVSPAWTLDDDGRPARLVSVGLTNKPNLPVHPVLNMRTTDEPKTEAEVMIASPAEPDEADKPEANAVQLPAEAETPKGPTMPEIKIALGLAEDATDEEVVAAVQALVAKIEEIDAEKKDAEAEKFAAENADCVADQGELKNEYIADPETAKKIVENCRKALAKVVANSAPVEAPVVNVAVAAEPVAANSFQDGLALCKTPEERVAFVIKNR